MNEESIVEYFSGHEGYKCGYCKSENTSYSYGMWAHTLSPANYQNLIDRGWRRSGKYCYKPTMHLTCCPQYTIRCEALKFVLSKSQKKVLKKVGRFLLNGEKEKEVGSHNKNGDHAMDTSVTDAMNLGVLKKIQCTKEIRKQKIETLDEEPLPSSSEKPSSEIKRDALVTTFSSSSSNVSMGDSSHLGVASVNASSSASSQKTHSTPNDRPCRKAKEIRRERKLQKLLKRGISLEEAMASLKKKSNEPKSVEAFLSESVAPNAMYNLELRLVPSVLGNPLFAQTFQQSYSVYKKYQMVIHKDPPEKCSESQYVRFLVKHPFQRLNGVSCAETSIYGSFHQQYWLNGKLIAVGVLDVLPLCISSVYFYYDPDYSFLSLGTYASLREISFTRELNKTNPNIKFYYMGFYIHSCPKMRYKGQYYPSFLLCPETYIYQAIEKCLPKLDVCKYHRLEEDPLKEDIDGVVNLSEVLILYNSRQMFYLSYRRLNRHANDQELVEEYARFVGRKCYQKMMLFRSS